MRAFAAPGNEAGGGSVCARGGVSAAVGATVRGAAVQLGAWARAVEVAVAMGVEVAVEVAGSRSKLAGGVSNGWPCWKPLAVGRVQGGATAHALARSQHERSRGQSQSTATLTTVAACSSAGSGPVRAQPQRSEPSVSVKLKTKRNTSLLQRRQTIEPGKQKKQRCAGGSVPGGQLAGFPSTRTGWDASKKDLGGAADPSSSGSGGDRRTNTLSLPSAFALPSGSSPARGVKRAERSPLIAALPS